MKFYLPNDNIKNKKVIIRVDFNVPIKDGLITDDTRIRAILPTIQALLSDSNKIIIISHLGRPKGENKPKLSLKPIATKLSEYLGCEIPLLTNWQENEELFNHNNIIILENLRFDEREEKNDEDFAKNLSSLADVYINDAFSCAHRAHASTDKITKFLPSFAGPFLRYEIESLGHISFDKNSRKLAIIAGSKISTKIALIENLLVKMDAIFIAGAMANNFLKVQGYEVGQSLIENEFLDIVPRILQKAKDNNCEILLPLDIIAADDLENPGVVKNYDVSDIPKDKKIFDIGPKTIELITKKLDNYDIVIWNGPVGAFEYQPFEQGTAKLAASIANLTKNHDLISIAGGGDTVAALGDTGKYFTYMSLAGGAFLEWLEGKDLPGLQNLQGYDN